MLGFKFLVRLAGDPIPGGNEAVRTATPGFLPLCNLVHGNWLGHRLQFPLLAPPRAWWLSNSLWYRLNHQLSLGDRHLLLQQASH